MWRVHYYLAWFLYIDGQEAMCNAFKDLGRNQIVLMLWLQKKKKKTLRNQHLGLSGINTKLLKEKLQQSISLLKQTVYIQY